MTDKTMAKLRSLLKTYEERAAKARPEPRTVDEEGERRREECGERLQRVVLPVLQAFVAELRSVGHGALIEDHTEGIDGYPSVGLAFAPRTPGALASRSEEHTSELQSRQYLVCRLLLEKKKITK